MSKFIAVIENCSFFLAEFNDILKINNSSAKNKCIFRCFKQLVKNFLKMMRNCKKFHTRLKKKIKNNSTSEVPFYQSE